MVVLKKLRTVALIALGLLWLGGWADEASASPFGQGVFGADVPFGSLTSITADVGTDLTMTLATGGFIGGPNDLSGVTTQAVTVTSTDVVGYSLYAHTLGSSNMVDQHGNTIPTSGNSTPNTIATGTWGLNTIGSDLDFQGLPTTSTLLKNADGPYKSGDTTIIKFGVVVSPSQGAGDYTVSVVYTVVARNP